MSLRLNQTLYATNARKLVFTARRYATAVYMLWPCVCPSVCLSVTSRCSTKTAQRRMTKITRLIVQEL